MRDLSKDIKTLNVLPPAARTATAAGTAVDRQGYEGVTLLVDIGAGGITFDDTNTLTVPMTHSDDGVTYTAVEAADVVITLPTGAAGTLAAGGVVRSLTAEHAAATITKVGYIGGKRYVNASDTRAGTHGTATPTAIVAILSHGYLKPAA